MGIAILLLLVAVALRTTRRPGRPGEGWLVALSALTLVLGYQAVTSDLL